MKEYVLNNNGYMVIAQYDEQDIENIYIPLLERWNSIQKEKGERVIVLLAAPPGCGKTTFSLFLQELSKTTEGCTPIQSIGMDGFHHYNEYLLSHTIIRDGKEILMKDVKGCPETFDGNKLVSKVKELKNSNVYWPEYSRILHNPVEDKVYVDGSIVLIEGNYLLLKQSPFDELMSLCDDTLMLTEDIQELETRLIRRKMKGNLSLKEATNFYQRSDGVNVQTVLKHSHQANITLYMNNGKVKKMEGM